MVRFVAGSRSSNSVHHRILISDSGASLKSWAVVTQWKLTDTALVIRVINHVDGKMTPTMGT